MAQLKALEPQLIAGVFRSPAQVDRRARMRRLRRVPRPIRRAARPLFYWPLTAKTKVLLISLVSGVTLLALAHADGVLGPPADPGRRWALDHLFSDNADVGSVSLSLLQDPAGLIVLAVVLVTPVFCCQQVLAISHFVQMNEGNEGKLQRSSHQVRQLDGLVCQVNAWFRWLGRVDVSVVIMSVMAIGTARLYAFVNDHGLMETWNPTQLPDTVWRSKVYAGWWANWDTHRELALALCAAGTYAFYFLAKQLAMGVIFTVYLHRSKALKFGVTPNMRFNSDGFQGLRPLRQFMLWTYGSALAHLIGLLVLFTVWLPAEPWMVFIVLVVMLVDMLVIVYPSSIGYHSALAVKKTHVATLYESSLPSDERDAAIAQVWSDPVLPVTTRKAMTGIILYLLVPAVPALIPLIFH
ncbi:hypothetical protein ACWD0J_33050 [Streptomyces sp. NPDC003011]